MAAGSMAFEVTEEDVENVLKMHSLAVANANGRPFSDMAEALFDDLDFSAIEAVAMESIDLDEQTNLAYDEIARQLRQMGILEPL